MTICFYSPRIEYKSSRQKGKFMRNKSKRKKIGQRKSVQKQIPRQWFYMSEHVVSARNIYKIYEDRDEIDAELWEAAGVVELTLPDGTFIDFEDNGTELKDVYSCRFLKEHQIVSLFYVTVGSDNFDAVKKEMQRVTQLAGGFFCGDTEDFQPVVK